MVCACVCVCLCALLLLLSVVVRVVGQSSQLQRSLSLLRLQPLIPKL